MFDHIEHFYRPATLRDALELLCNGEGHGRIVAGATDIVTQADRSTRFLVDIAGLGLDYIRRNGEGYAIGAAVTMAALENSPAVRGLAGGILAKAASSCGSIQNRNMATVGGNLANASPAADTAVVFLALGAEIVVTDALRKRQIALAEFYHGPHRTILDGALLEEVVIPPPPGGEQMGWSFQKLGRTATDISLVNVATGLQVDAQGRIEWVRLALGAVAPTPMRAHQAEAMLLGSVLNEDLLKQVRESVMTEVSPIADLRASADYRREMSGVLTVRALRECAAHAGRKL